MNSFFVSSEGKIKCWNIGLVFSLVGYVIAVILVPLLTKGSITQKELLVGIPAWTLGGLVSGFIMKIATEKKNKNS